MKKLSQVTKPYCCVMNLHIIIKYLLQTLCECTGVPLHSILASSQIVCWYLYGWSRFSRYKYWSYKQILLMNLQGPKLNTLSLLVLRACSVLWLIFLLNVIIDSSTANTAEGEKVYTSKVFCQTFYQRPEFVQSVILVLCQHLINYWCVYFLKIDLSWFDKLLPL